jgi:hypothetical protein
MEHKADPALAVRSDQAARILSLSTSTLRSWRRQGRGPRFARLGRRVVYPIAALKEFIGENTEQPKERHDE